MYKCNNIYQLIVLHVLNIPVANNQANLVLTFTYLYYDTVFKAVNFIGLTPIGPHNKEWLLTPLYCVSILLNLLLELDRNIKCNDREHTKTQGYVVGI